MWTEDGQHGKFTKMVDSNIAEAVKKLNPVFIAGAPRSGTTLLSNLLDNHPELIVFPMEHSTLEHYFWPLSNNDVLFHKEFISNRKYGQQSVLADEARYAKYQAKILSEFGNSFELDVNCDEFYRSYIAYIERYGHHLLDVFRALIYALAKSNEYILSKVEHARYMVFKQPFYTELFAQKTFECIPNSRFIHISRDVTSRYVSAKMRRLKMAKANGYKGLSQINGFDFILGHCMVDLSSEALRMENESIIGNAHQTIEYDELVTDSYSTLHKVSRSLGISLQAGESIALTRLGVSAIGGSSFVSSSTIDVSAADRSKQFRANTTVAERGVLSYYLLSAQKKLNIGVRLRFSIMLFLPWKWSGISSIKYRLKDIRYVWQSLPIEDFIDQAREGKIEISGAT